MPKISVIIPNYNHGSYLGIRIESILQQTFTDFEIIIMDDGSTDNSRTIIEQYRGNPKFSHIITSEVNSGSPFKLWSKGIELAKGEWIWIAESDDIAEPEFLEEAVRAIERHPSIDIFYCDSFVIDENGRKDDEKFSERKNKVFGTQKWSASYFNKGIDEVNECLKFDCTINNMSSAVIRKTTAANIAPETAGFKFHGDWFFLLKARFNGNIFYCDRPLNHYRIHSKSHSTKQTLLGSRYECFKILHLLYYNKEVTGKEALLEHFTYNCLGFGLLKDGLKKGWQLYGSYRRIDKSLAKKVMLKLAAIKLFRKKRPFFVTENNKNYSYQL